jgi:hypothetical protein
MKLNVVVGDLEPILLHQTILNFLQEGQLHFYEVGMVDYPTATCADKMMVMILARWALDKLISCPAVTEIEFEDNAHIDKHLEGSVHGGEPDGGIVVVHLDIDILSAEMSSQLGKHFQNGLPSRGYPVTGLPYLAMGQDLSLVFHRHSLFLQVYGFIESDFQ